MLAGPGPACAPSVSVADERLDGPAGRGVSARGTFLQQTAVGWQVLQSLSPVRLTHAPGLICGRVTRMTRQPTPREVDGHEGFPSRLCSVIAHADHELSGASGSPLHQTFTIQTAERTRPPSSLGRS